MQRVPSPFVRRRAGETRRMRLAAEPSAERDRCSGPSGKRRRLAFRSREPAQGIADVDPASHTQRPTDAETRAGSGCARGPHRLDDWWSKARCCCWRALKCPGGRG